MEYLDDKDLKVLIDLVGNSVTIHQGQTLYNKLVTEHKRRLEDFSNKQKDVLRQELLKEINSKHGESKDTK